MRYAELLNFLTSEIYPLGNYESYPNLPKDPDSMNHLSP
jgi:hypothetical protein